MTDFEREAGVVEPAPAVGRVDLEAALAAQNGQWRDRAIAADALAVDAFRRYGRWVPVDVVLDIHNALQPPEPLPLRPSVPVIPGPEG